MNTASADIGVSLDSPTDGYVQNISNATFICNISTDNNPSYMRLFAGTDSFSELGSKYLNGLEPENGTVLLMHFNNDSFAGESGTHVYDWSRYQNNGTVGSVYYNATGGRVFGAYEFNGTNNKITVADSASLDLVSEGSIEFWIKVNGVNGLKDRVLMKGYSWGNGFPYAIYLGPGIKVYLWLEDSNVEVASASNLNPGEWYHIVATWNDSDAVIYVNGSLDQSGAGPGSMYSNDHDLEIGGKTTDWGSESPFNGTIDELIIYNRSLTQIEVSSHYNSSFGNVTSAEWNVSLSDGTYSWNCLAYDNETSNWSSQNYTLFVDVWTPPQLNSIVLTPNSQDEVDPDVNINVTANLSDPSGVNSSVFQYRRLGLSEWVNITMNNVSVYNWNASFSMPSPPDVWEYRVWSNDSLGHSGTSQTYNITTDYDYTWNSSPASLGEIYVLFGTNESLGMLTINNTGDYPLNFRLVSGFSETYYNISDHDSFDIPAKESKAINISVTAPSEPEEYTVSVKVDATSGDAEPGENWINATMISYWGGPYLTASITESEVIAYQSSSGLNYSARIKNIGNDTATGVWINWTLPAGWSNVSGNISTYTGNITNGSIIWSNISVSLGSDAEAGVASVAVNANCSEGANGTDSVAVAVLCNNDDGVCGAGCSYTSDDDCPPPSGGTSGTGTTVSGGGVAKTNYGLSLSAPERVDINRGENKNFSVFVDYGHTFTADDIRIDVSGYPLTYVSVEPEEFDMVNAGDWLEFRISLRAPPYIKAGEYALSVDVTGKGSVVNITLSGETGVLVFVHSAGNESDIIEEAREVAQEMISMNLSVQKMEDMISRMDAFVNNWDYDNAIAIAEHIIGVSETANSVIGMTNRITEDISTAATYGLGTPETDKLLQLSQSAFQRGDYERAEERASNALLSYSVETFGIIPLLLWSHANWWMVALIICISVAASLGMRRRSVRNRVKNSIRDLEKEWKTIEGVMIRMQRDYFSKKHSGGTSLYNIAMKEYGDRLAEIGRLVIRLKSHQKASGRTLKGLSHEKMSISDSIKELQKRYFQKSDISKSLYEGTFLKMKQELGDVEKSIDMLSNKRKGSSKPLLVCFFMVMMLSATVFAQHEKDAAASGISEAWDAINDLMEAGFGTSFANDTLNEAMIMMSRGEYAAATALSRGVWDIRDAAFDADRLIDTIEEEIYRVSGEGIDTHEAVVLLDQGILLFGSENYLESKEVLEEALLTLERIESETVLESSALSSLGNQVIMLLNMYWQYLLASAAVFVLIAFGFRQHRKRSALRRKLAFFENERSSLERMIAKIQNRYFRSGGMGKFDYDVTIERYMKRIAEVEKNIVFLKRT